MTLFGYLEQTPAAFVAAVFVLGLLVGSFLNVVILRLPRMLELEWRAQCQEFLGQAGDAPAERFSLWWPPSRCPQCQHSIRPWENVPVVSYMLLRGRCSECKTRISPRYPIIELVTAGLSAYVAWHFGFGIEALAALALTWSLIALSVIDFDHQILPDSITLPMLWLGLLASLVPVFIAPQASIIGAAAGYLALWSVYHAFRLLTGKEGMGYGDFKLLAMLGAWLGWQALPVIILLSSLVGALVGITLIVALGRDRNVPIPFGPYLAAAGWLTMLWGDQIIDTYVGIMGLN
jgi:leader peptidase (prepilin peptidase)/N-methyltransferase